MSDVDTVDKCGRGLVIAREKSGTNLGSALLMARDNSGRVEPIANFRFLTTLFAILVGIGLSLKIFNKRR